MKLYFHCIHLTVINQFVQAFEQAFPLFYEIFTFKRRQDIEIRKNRRHMKRQHINKMVLKLLEAPASTPQTFTSLILIFPFHSVAKNVLKHLINDCANKNWVWTRHIFSYSVTYLVALKEKILRAWIKLTCVIYIFKAELRHMHPMSFAHLTTSLHLITPNSQWTL